MTKIYLVVLLNYNHALYFKYSINWLIVFFPNDNNSKVVLMVFKIRNHYLKNNTWFHLNFDQNSYDENEFLFNTFVVNSSLDTNSILGI